MKIPDANILIYAHDQTSPYHLKARSWLREALTDPSEPVAIASVVAHAFVRIVSNSKIGGNPVPMAAACATVQTWLDRGAIWCEPGPGHFSEVGRLVTQAQGGLKLLPDAHLAALALHHRAVIYSNDRDFQRFPGLRVKNPVV